MKTLRFLWAAMIAVCLGVCFTACSDDDDNTIGNGNNGGTIKTENSVTVETAGTLSLLLGDNVQHITSLKIKGPLNGDDIICLRQMLRCTDEDADKRGMLTVLDISDASIVAGGDGYYGRDSTSNNRIGNRMFCNCESLQKISLPNSVTSLGDSAFYNCRELTQVAIGSSVTTIRSNAFRNCTVLSTITIPNSVTSIGSYAFAYCKGLTEIAISNSIKSIANYTFSNCSGLTSVTIPESVTEIGSSAFAACTSLTNVTIPNSVRTIGDYTFNNCSGLTEVTIGNSVTKIGYRAFYYSSGLESLTSLNPEPPSCGSSVFYEESQSICTLYVPKGSKETYSTASQWKDFTNIVEMN